MVRIAQGLLHLGKGLMTLSPYHCDRFILHHAALGSLLTVLYLVLDAPAFLLDGHHYLLYYLTGAMLPRMLITLDEDLQPLPVLVRVGQAIDTVGQAGHPRTITGFQTHTTPVLLAHGERAELADEQYLPLASVLENVVIMRKNPEYTK